MEAKTTKCTNPASAEYAPIGSPPGQLQSLQTQQNSRSYLGWLGRPLVLQVNGNVTA